MSEPTTTPSTTATEPQAQPTAPPTRGENEPASVFGDRLRNDAFARAMAALDRQEKEAVPDETPAAPAAETAPAEEQETGDTQATPEPAPEPEPVKPAAELESDRIVRALEEQRAAMRELERQRSEYEAKSREIETQRADLAKLAQAHKALSEGDALTALAELGVSYEDLTKAVISGAAPKVEPKSPVLSAIEELKAEQAALKDQLAKREAEAARHAALSHVRSEVPASDFPLLAAHGDWEAEVIEGVRLEWERAGFVGDAPPVTPRQIAERLEAYLTEETLRRAKLSPKVLEALKAANDPSQVKPKEAAQASAAPATPNVSGRPLLPTDTGSVTRIANGVDEATAKARALAVLEQLGR